MKRLTVCCFLSLACASVWAEGAVAMVVTNFVTALDVPVVTNLVTITTTNTFTQVVTNAVPSPAMAEEERARVCGLIYGTISLLTAVFPSLIGQMAEVSLRLPFAVCMGLFVFAGALVFPLSGIKAHEEDA